MRAVARGGPHRVGARWLSGAAWLALAVCLAGCSGRCPSSALPTLHLPHVRELPGGEVPGTIGAFEGIATYIGPDRTSSSPRAHIVAGNGGLYTVMGLDGSDPYVLSNPDGCRLDPAVSRDGKWFACGSFGAAEIIALGSTQQSRWRLPLSDRFSGQAYALAWSPDGQYLALTEKCGVSIYAPTMPSDSPTASARLVMFLNFDAAQRAGMLVNPCKLTGLSWSDDGAWLAAVDAEDAYGGNTVYAVPFGAHAPSTGSGSGKTVTVDAAALGMRAVGTSWTTYAPAWIPGSDVLTYVSPDQRSVVETSVDGQISSTLITQSVAAIAAVSWTPDGQHLAFAVDGALQPVVVTPTAAATSTVTTASIVTTSSTGLPGDATIITTSGTGGVSGHMAPAAPRDVALAMPLGICVGPSPDFYVYSPPFFNAGT